LALDAFAGDARPHHFRQAVDIDRVDAGTRLDLGAHRIGPRLRAKDPDLKRTVGRIEALAREFLDDVEHVGRRHHDDARLEILDQLDLLFGLGARHRDHGATELFGTVVGAETAGKQAVTIGEMNHVARPPARRADRACDYRGPGVDVIFGIADHRRFAGGAAR